MIWPTKLESVNLAPPDDKYFQAVYSVPKKFTYLPRCSRLTTGSVCWCRSKTGPLMLFENRATRLSF